MSFVIKYMNKKRWLFLAYQALILEAITPVLAALYQRQLIDQVFMDKVYSQFPILIIMYAVFFFSPRLFFTIRKVTFFHISHHMQMHMSKIFLNKIFTLPNQVIEKEETGKLLNHIRTDIQTVTAIGINQVMNESVKILLSIIVLTLAIAMINLYLLLVVILVSLVYYTLLHRFSDKTKSYAHQVQVNKGHVSNEIEESISSMREVIAFNRQDWQEERFEKSYRTYFQSLLKEARYKVKITLVSEPFLYASKLLVIVFGGLSLHQGRISVGDFVISFTLIDQLVTEMEVLFHQGLSMKKLEAGIAILKGLLDKDNESFGTDLLGPIRSIEFKNVYFRYDSSSEYVLEDLSFKIESGQKVAFIGESGSGKSTISQILLRNYPIEAGQVLINGLPIESYANYTERISAVLQEPHFLPVSVHDNLCFDKNYENNYLIAISKSMICHDFVENLPDKYQTHVGEKACRLSGGQRQRLSLARAMLRSPDLLILDEATSALDTETEDQVMKNIDKMRKGLTTIVIAHRLSTIQNADMVINLSKIN